MSGCMCRAVYIEMPAYRQWRFYAVDVDSRYLQPTCHGVSNSTRPDSRRCVTVVQSTKAVTARTLNKKYLL